MEVRLIRTVKKTLRGNSHVALSRATAQTGHPSTLGIDLGPRRVATQLEARARSQNGQECPVLARRSKDALRL